MKQLTIFDCSSSNNTIASHSTNRPILWKLFVDGASRKNPGHAGAGIYLLKNNIPAYKEGFYLGIRTNNEAEYLALLLGIFFTKPLLYPHDTLEIVSDSQLLIRQIKGHYRVKKPMLQQLHAALITLLASINYSCSHVLRDQNVQADELANQGIDKGNPLPKDFIEFMHSCNIFLPI